MKVVLKVTFEVKPCEEGKVFERGEVEEAVQEAMRNTLDDRESGGYEHFMEDEISIRHQYIELDEEN